MISFGWPAICCLFVLPATHPQSQDYNMAIDPVSNKTNLYQLDAQTRAQGRKDFKSLQNDLQSGDISGAQKDFATLLQDVPQLQSQLPAASSTTPASPGTSVSSEFNSLSAALSAGDLTGAQTAMSSLQQSSGGYRHHHHHHGGGGSSTPTDPWATTTSTGGISSPAVAL